MASSVSYSVSSSGGVVEGHEPDTVISEFCTIFGVQKEKAAAYIESQKLIKKDLSEAQAFAYRDKFNKMGIPVTLKKHDVEMPDEFGGLSLTPANEPSVEAPPVAASTLNTGAKNPLADQSMQDITKNNSSEKNTRSVEPPAVLRNTDDEDSFSDNAETSVASIGVAIVVAIIGAFLWQFLAVNMEVEYALAAWAIGAAIGGSAAYFGARSDFGGVLCAALLVLAIAGGKFMTAGYYADQYNATPLNDSDDIAMMLEDYQDDARRFSRVGDDPTSVKRFMAKYGYSYSENSDEIDDEELADFKLNTAPMLKEMHENSTELLNSPVMYAAMYDAEAPPATIATSEIFGDLWGPLDLLFLLLGAASAYKLASGRELR